MFEKTYKFIPRYGFVGGTMPALQEFYDSKKFLEEIHGFPIEFVKCKVLFSGETAVIYKRKKIPVYIGRIVEEGGKE